MTEEDRPRDEFGRFVKGQPTEAQSEAGKKGKAKQVATKEAQRRASAERLLEELSPEEVTESIRLLAEAATGTTHTTRMKALTILSPLIEPVIQAKAKELQEKYKVSKKKLPSWGLIFNGRIIKLSDKSGRDLITYFVERIYKTEKDSWAIPKDVFSDDRDTMARVPVRDDWRTEMHYDEEEETE